MKRGFTLIELLVVVAIVAVIGAGVAVTFNRLDERAKVAVELNDCATLQRTIMHWSALHDFKLPDRMDSLIDENGRLYAIDVNGVAGLYSPGVVFTAATPPDAVLESLRGAGMEAVQTHLTDAAVANDSTFTISETGAKRMDVSGTVATLADPSEAAGWQAIYDAQGDAMWWDYDSGPFVLAGKSYGSFAEFEQALNDARDFDDARRVEKLAFLCAAEDAGSVNDLVIAAIGISPDDVAPPSEDPQEAASRGRTCYLVAFGLGRFAGIHRGNGARVLSPVAGKRVTDANVYSHYLALVRVPVIQGADDSQTPRVQAVLSPQGLTQSMLSDLYRNEAAAEGN